MNINASHLYDPLRNTLDKSIVGRPELDLNNQRQFQKISTTSRVSRKMRSLSPDEANFIKRSTIIPIDKQLVPTDNLWKVQGKQFTAVNVQVKQGPPIPASSIVFPSGYRGGGRVTTETVYQLRPKHNNRINFDNTRSITHLRSVLPINRQTINPPPSSIGRQSSLDYRRPASPIRVNPSPNFYYGPSNEYQIQPMPKAINNNENIRYEQEKLNKGVIKPMQNTVSTVQSKQINPNYKKQKSQYKYNFFSAIDEAVNTKCGSCGGNEFIASKPFSSWQ